MEDLKQQKPTVKKKSIFLISANANYAKTEKPAKKNGWLIIWVIILILGVFNTPATAPCSIEYFIYCEPVSGTIKVAFGGLIEILIQTFLFSIVSFYAIKHGEKRV